MIGELFSAPWRTCRYTELEPVEIQNAKTSTALLKIGEQKLLLNLSDIEVKTFLKKTISVLSIHLHLLGDTLDKHSEWFNPNSFSEMYTQEITLVNSHLIILYVYYQINYIPWILLYYFYLWLKFLHLVTGWFNRIKLQ